MRWSRSLIVTKRETPKDAEVISYSLMLRAGMINKLASGIFNYLPLGTKAIKKVENIVRDEMNKSGAIEVIMPMVIPSELWKETGRWDKYGKELLRFQDRQERWFCIGPTHEEVIADIIRREIKSYRDLPLNIYQIHTKFRDEIRPRFGLMRAREFIMKDAYSFDIDDECAEKSYQKMYETYKKIFERCGLKFKIVEAETGAIGGSFSHEFMVTADTGEDVILSCDKCDYSANRERAETIPGENKIFSGYKIELVPTPGKRTVDEVSDFLNLPKSKIIKSLLYKTEKEKVLLLLRGDYELNEQKTKRYLGVDELSLLEDNEIIEVISAERGFIGPVGLNIRTISDYSILDISDGACGANKNNYHFINVTPGRDFEIKEIADIRFAEEGDTCSRCKTGKLKRTRGIEVGHIFKLGTKYSKSMNAKFLDSDGNEKPIIMGCYGIGIGRTVAAAIEQNHDEKGIIFPLPIAPYEIGIIPIRTPDGRETKIAEDIYQILTGSNLDVLIDDRDESPGVKFNDMDLIGIPVQIIIGKKIKDNIVEVRTRDRKIKQDIPINEVKGRINKIITDHFYKNSEYHHHNQ